MKSVHEDCRETALTAYRRVGRTREGTGEQSAGCWCLFCFCMCVCVRATTTARQRSWEDVAEGRGRVGFETPGLSRYMQDSFKCHFVYATRIKRLLTNASRQKRPAPLSTAYTTRTHWHSPVYAPCISAHCPGMRSLENVYAAGTQPVHTSSIAVHVHQTTSWWIGRVRTFAGRHFSSITFY